MFPAALTSGPGGGGLTSFLRSSDRQPDCKRRTFSKLAGNIDRTGAVSNDSVGDGQADSHACTHSLGGKAGLENAAKVLLWNSFAGIANLDHSKAIFFVCSDIDSSLSLDRLPGIDEQVHVDLVELADVAK